MMKVFSDYRDGRLTIRLQGELDHHEARQGMEAIDALLDEYMPRDCAVDLGALSFMDSSGIALILKLHRRLAAVGGRARVENAAAQPLRVLKASGIERFIAPPVKKEADA